MAGPTAKTSSGHHRTLLTDPRLLAIVFVAFMGPMSVNVVSPALPNMASGLAVTDAEIGLVITAITLPTLFLAPVFGVAGDIYSRRKIVLWSLLLFGIAGTAITFVETFRSVLILRGLQGVAMAGIAPMAVTLLGDLYSGPVGSTAQGLRNSASGASSALTPLIAGALVTIGWNVPFLLYALSFVVIVIFYVYVPETARGMDTDSSIGAELHQYARSMRSEVDRDLFIMTAGGFIRFFLLFGILTFMPLFAARELNATPVVIGLLLATKAIRILVSPSAGLLVSWVSRRVAITGSLVVLTLSTLAMPFSPSVLWLGLLMLVNTIGDSFFSPLVDDTVTGFVKDENRSGTVSILRVFKEAGKTLSPVGLGIILAITNFEVVFFGLAGIVALYIIPILFIMEAPERRLTSIQSS